MLVTFVSAKGSPGVTTAVLAIGAEWPQPRPAVVIDADPAGGDIPAGLGQGAWPRDATLIGLAGEARSVSVETALRALVYRAGEHAPLVLGGVTTPGQAQALPWTELLPGLRAIGDADLLCDGGRFQPGAGIEPLLQASDHVVLVTGSTLPAVRAAARISELLREVLPTGPAGQLWLLVVAPDRPFRADEIAASCGAGLLGALPHDPGTAAVWSDGHAPRTSSGWGLRRGGGFWDSSLQRAAGEIADRLAELGGSASAGPAGVPKGWSVDRPGGLGGSL
ncbi:hypothetical protein BJF78_26250 [Pseudonocardia sp. CNS-139]|nr:hypothetical protein BJF78_26250 [Pseudonocardia sp. CNS-139]